MPVQLYLAPAGAGKTEFLVQHVRQAAAGLNSAPRVCVASALQARSWRQRLAAAGGAIGVMVVTFDRLVADCLQTGGAAVTMLPDPVLYRLMRAVVDELDLRYYAALKNRPGFIQVLRRLIDEFKAAQISPDTLAAAATQPRLRELAQIYARYQLRLRQQNWADGPGLDWLAINMLQSNPGSDIAANWPLLIFDGFDNFTTLHLTLLKILAERAGKTIITLTGAVNQPQRAAHHRFFETRARLEQLLNVTAQPLPLPAQPPAPALAHLESWLFQPAAPKFNADASGDLALIAAPDRAAEVREALRWLKQRIALDGVPPGQTALLARAISPYRAFILQTAAEFGLPIRLLDGLPLRGSPIIAALLTLLRLGQPAAGSNQPALPRRLVVEVWRSPYFNWNAGPEPIGLEPGDADRLDAAARYGRVIAGPDQWDEALAALARKTGPSAADEPDDDPPPAAPVGAAARQLQAKFHRFVARVTPPAGAHAYREFVLWLEQLIGPDNAEAAAASLQLAAQAAGPADRAALRTLKDVLRGLVLAEEMVGAAAIDFARFLQELEGAIEAATYRHQLETAAGGGELLVADVVQARGVPFTAVAVLGLAEGEFPAAITEDPFLREADRANLGLTSAVQSAEREFFYETITRPRHRLLFTRPRLTETGVEWPPSPFWEEAAALTGAPTRLLTSAEIPTATEAASLAELLDSAAAGNPAARAWLEQNQPARLLALHNASRIFSLRQQRAEPGPFDGDLGQLQPDFTRRFAPGQPWSASRLETYRTCPYMFFVSHVLHLEPRPEPAVGLEAWQLGNIYHRIFEQLYRACANPANAEQLLANLDAVAGPILDNAPAVEGFRQTDWWAHTRQEISANVRLSVQKLAELPGDFTPAHFEARFTGDAAVTIAAGSDYFRVRGCIDRIDINPAGQLRVIDYKTSHAAGFKKSAARLGKKLQLPLYALAARDALNLGQPIEGFYWHIHQAQPSDFTLAGSEDGPEGAIAVAVAFAWEAVRGARAGQFTPQPPPDGCPQYCPAAAFCWHYRPGRR